MLSQVDAAIPTIVLGVRDSRGRDVRDATVTVDGADQPAALQGRSVPVNPGPHVLRVTRGATAVEQTVVAHEAERDRFIVVQLEPPVSPVEPPVSPAETPTASPPTPRLVYVLGGLSFAAFGLFAFFTADGQSRYNTCESAGCSPSTTDALGRERTIAWSTLAVAVLAGTAAVWTFVRSRSGVRAGLGLQPSGLTLHVGVAVP